MEVGEYEQRAIYKRYNVVGNGPDSVLETCHAIYYVHKQVTGFSMAVMNRISVVQTRHCNQVYQGYTCLI